jgi:hypothetical protein
VITLTAGTYSGEYGMVATTVYETTVSTYDEIDEAQTVAVYDTTTVSV